MGQKIFLVKNSRETVVIHTDLLYAVTVEDYVCTFYQENRDPFKCTKSLTELVLPSHFFRISRNAIINIHKIDTLSRDKREVVLTSKMKLYGSVRKMRELLRFLEEYDINFE
jgi:DNA-binding LytR/AlgR family response regulator